MSEAQNTTTPPDEQPKRTPKPERRHLRELARKATEDCIAALRAAVKTGPPNVAVQAAQALLDRGWGRPPQTPTSEPEPGAHVVVRLLPTEHRDLAQSLEQRIDALIAAHPETPPAAPIVGRPVSSHALEAAPAPAAAPTPRTEPESTPPQVDTGYIASVIRQNGCYFPGD